MYLQENDRYLKSRITQEDELKSIKFYMTDIIFDLLNGNNQPQHITWVSTNQLVGEKLKIRFQMLENCENYDENKTKTNLIMILNGILYEKNPHCLNLLMKEKHCRSCTEIVFYRIKTFCCKTFICSSCLADDKKKNVKCMICKKPSYQNKKEFGHLIKCLCLIRWKKKRVDTKEIEPMLEKRIEKLNMPSKTIKENTLHIEAGRIMHDIVCEVCGLEEEVKKISTKYSFLNKIRYQDLICLLNIWLQCCMIRTFGYGWVHSCKFALTNNILPTLYFKYIGLRTSNANFDPKIKNKNILCDRTQFRDMICNESKKVFLSSLSFLIGFYVQGNNYLENFTSVIFTFPLCLLFLLIIQNYYNSLFSKKFKLLYL